MAVTIYHNPKCSKSRETLALLEARGVKPVIVNYLRDVPSHNMLSYILDMLGMEPREFIRKTEKEYVEHNLASRDLTRDQLIQAMVDYPCLIERPVVVCGSRAALGRPPENVLQLLREDQR